MKSKVQKLREKHQKYELEMGKHVSNAKDLHETIQAQESMIEDLYREN